MAMKMAMKMMTSHVMFRLWCGLSVSLLCGCVRLGFGGLDDVGAATAGDSWLLGDASADPDGHRAPEAGLDFATSGPDLSHPPLPDAGYPVIGTLTDAHADCGTLLRVDLKGLPAGPVAVSAKLQNPTAATALCPGSPSVMIEISNAPASVELSCPGNGSTPLGWSKSCPLPRSSVIFTNLVCGTKPVTLPTGNAKKSYLQLCLTLSQLPSMLVFTSVP